MSIIYTLANQKGGVGKTTTAINLSAYLAHYGQKVLIIDLDPQANATSCLGVDKHSVQGGTYEVMIGSAPASSYILFHAGFKLSLLPSSTALAGAEVELVTLVDRESRLRKALQAIQDRYDYIFIDCPPSLGLLTLNGLVAAQNGVMIPVQCEYLALEGIGHLTQTLNRIRSGLFPGLKVRGVVLTMFDTRTKLSHDVVAEVRRHFPNQVFQAVIPRSIRLAEAPSYGQPISAFAPESSGGQAYSALARELLDGDGIQVRVPQV